MPAHISSNNNAIEAFSLAGSGGSDEFIQVGYTSKTAKLPLPEQTKESINIKFIVSDVVEKTDLASKATGPVFIGASYPKASNKSITNILSCAAKRIGAITPQIKPQRLREITEFTIKFVKENFKQLPKNETFDFNEWLNNAPYTPDRKQELLEVYETLGTDKLNAKDLRVKSFIKEESYDTYKCARGIYSRSDRFKCVVAPLIAKIQHVIFSNPAFIKTVPVSDRPKFIEDLFLTGEGNYYAGDYTAYESHFTKEYMEAIEFEVYKYICAENPEALSILKIFMDAVSGTNYIIFRLVSLTVEATRMSGEMNTSLGNGLVNFIIINFICTHLHKSSVRLIVEGDDSLFQTVADITSQDFIDCGLTCKLERHETINTASFCGLLYHPLTLDVITDPIKVILKTPYLPRKWSGSSKVVRLQILKCKALSILWQYPGCPILTSYAKWILRETCHLKIRKTVLEFYKKQVFYQTAGLDYNIFLKINSYQSVLTETPCKEVSLHNRLLLEEKYAISIDEQIEIEKFYDSQGELRPYHHDLILNHCNSDQIHNFHSHVFEVPMGMRNSELFQPQIIPYAEQHEKMISLLLPKTSRKCVNQLLSALRN